MCVKKWIVQNLHIGSVYKSAKSIKPGAYTNCPGGKIKIRKKKQKDKSMIVITLLEYYVYQVEIRDNIAIIKQNSPFGVICGEDSSLSTSTPS